MITRDDIERIAATMECKAVFVEMTRHSHIAKVKHWTRVEVREGQYPHCKTRYLGDMAKIAQFSEEELCKLITSKINKEGNVEPSRH